VSQLPDPITRPPDEAELELRLERVRRSMADHQLDYYVSFDPVNVYYLTNFGHYVHERPFLLVISRQGPPIMLAPFLELSHVRERARCELQFVTYDEYPAPKGQNWFDVYSTLFPADARVGIEQAMPVGIARKTPGTPIPVDLIDVARFVKTDYEIGRTMHACSVVDLAHAELLDACKPGVPESTIFATVNGIMRQKIFGDIPDANFIMTSTLAGVWPPSISHDPHRIPRLTQQMEYGGPHVSIVSAQVDGYGVELERTFFLGEVPDSAREPFDVMLKARAKAFEMLMPGQHMGDIDAAVRKVISDAGYEDWVLHRTGHSLGITGHEGPFLAIGEDRLLEAGMLVSVEPGLYKEGKGGYRHSDTVLVTDDGFLSLTHAPDQLDGLVLQA
jgi:Xaa-Pro dipeptidase